MEEPRVPTVDEVSRACPGWGVRYEAFADGPGRWYAVHPAYGFSPERPLTAGSGATLVARVWEAEARGPRRRPGAGWPRCRADLVTVA